jgi:hypothetical protein
MALYLPKERPIPPDDGTPEGERARKEWEEEKQDREGWHRLHKSPAEHEAKIEWLKVRAQWREERRQRRAQAAEEPQKETQTPPCPGDEAKSPQRQETQEAPKEEKLSPRGLFHARAQRAVCGPTGRGQVAHAVMKAFAALSLEVREELIRRLTEARNAARSELPFDVQADILKELLREWAKKEKRAHR